MVAKILFLKYLKGVVGSTHSSALAVFCLSVLLWAGCTFFAHALLFLPVFAVDNTVRMRKAFLFGSSLALAPDTIILF